MAQDSTPSSLGVIDALSIGLSLALVQPWLLTMSCLMDAYLWLGARVSPAALTDPLARWITDAGGSDGSGVADTIADGSGTDVLALMGVLVPTFFGGVDRSAVYALLDRPTWAPAHWTVVIVVALGAVVLAAACFAAYAIPLADAILGRRRTLRAMLQAAGIAWLRVLALVGLIVGVTTLVVVPSAVVVGLFQAAGIDLGSLVALLGLGLLVVVYVFGYFVLDAIVVSEVGPLRAIRLSVAVVRQNLRPTIGLVLATILIQTGLPQLWAALADNPPGLLIAVIANAFFAAGVAMASMNFFNERLRRWRPDLAYAPTAADGSTLTSRGK